MNDQPVIDAYHHTDLRKTRAAFNSVIPVETGLAQGVERFLPHLADKIQARALRVPTSMYRRSMLFWRSIAIRRQRPSTK